MSIGDKLKKAVLVPAATPIKSGKFLEAANKEENHLDQIISNRYQGKVSNLRECTSKSRDEEVKGKMMERRCRG
jgi:hypothetical protein